ncbi:MAG: acyltransferase [Rhizobiaceae bacterium]|nr:acyltransferase [Rhizobiaceae bacterium]MCV0405590.1 acyltransferase [Rhizobiaceae bacterium]
MHAPHYQARSGLVGGFRPDIQGLRAIAVGTVLIFHVYPPAMTGGYVGVDVFFVISGYLISMLLIKAALREGGVRFLEFYSRRFRRLLPAASVVLLVVAALTFTLPPSRWTDTAGEIIASALYVENWSLAARAVDYLGADAAPSPLQHFWSLSIEEQFYLFWPAVIAICLAAARRTGTDPRRVLFWTFTALTGVSLVFSVTLTQTNPQQTYFLSHTRFWELGVGGMLAVWLYGRPALPLAPRRVLAFAGLGAILAAAFLFTTSTSFPGAWALLPVLGTAAVLTAGHSDGPGPALTRVLLENRLAQWLGDISYSLYLWHWPVVVFHNAWFGAEIGPVDAAAMVAVSLLLADLSKRFVEDRFRHPPTEGRPGHHARTLSAGLASMLTCVAAGAMMIGFVQLRSSEPGGPDMAAYPGARVVSEGVTAIEGVAPIPDLAVAREDVAAVYGRGCHGSVEATEPTPCEFGDPGASFHVVVAGDSHAATWSTAFQEIARRRDWRLTVVTKSSCPPLGVPIIYRDGRYSACEMWTKAMLDLVRAERPDLVVLAMSPRYAVAPDGRPATLADGAARTLQALRDAQIPAAVFRDIPYLRFEPLECVAADPDCSTTLAESGHKIDPMVIASETVDQIPLLDLNDIICPEGICPMVQGNVVAWRDSNHLTATYISTLTTALEARLIQAGIGARTIGAAVAAEGPPRRSVTLDMDCGPLGAAPALQRQIVLHGAKDIYQWRLGEESDPRFEHWRLVVDGKGFAISGRYREGAPEVKDVHMKGSIHGSRFEGAGRRGPRECTVTGAYF